MALSKNNTNLYR